VHPSAASFRVSSTPTWTLHAGGTPPARPRAPQVPKDVSEQLQRRTQRTAGIATAQPWNSGILLSQGVDCALRVMQDTEMGQGSREKGRRGTQEGRKPVQ